jgi:hypothetical protein
MKLSKAIIKKYGITKKAWSVARSRASSDNIKQPRMVKSMAKKRYNRKSSSGNMMKAPIKLPEMAKDAIAGVGAALIISKYAANINIPYKAPIAGYLVGGVPGALAAWFVAGQNSTATSGGITLN